MAIPLQSGSKALPEIPVEFWPTTLQQAVQEVFSTMVGTQVGVAADQKLRPGRQVAGVIGIGGAFTAVLSLRCSEVSAGKIAAQMLGVPPAEALAQSSDAIGEICNMVAGHFKAKVGHEATCMLSLPSVITGTNYSVHSAHNSEIQLPFLYEGEALLVLLDIRK
jgi:chemotaxis protein CheX